MDTTLFVTCGRGLGVFAKEEIQKKLINVTKIHELGEGKISFTITHHSQHLGTSDECATETNTTLKMKKDSYLSDVAPVFQLKLVERIFLLLHCERTDTCIPPVANPHSGDTTAVDSIYSNYKMRLESIVKRTKWWEIRQTVQLLRDHQKHMSGPWVKCQDPSSHYDCTEAENHSTYTHHTKIDPYHIYTHCHTDTHPQHTHTYHHTEAETHNTHHTEMHTHHTHTHHHYEAETHNTHHTEAHTHYKHRLTPANKKKRKLLYKSSGRASKNKCNSHKLGVDSSDKYRSEEYSITGNDGKNVQFAGIKEKPLLPSKKIAPEPTSEKLVCEAQKFDQSLGLSSVKVKESQVCEDRKVSSSDEASFRVSSRISGVYKSVLSKEFVNQSIIRQLCEIMTTWTLNYRKPLMDIYINITDAHFIIGVSVSERPLSLRVYAAHLPLRSTIGYLMARLASINPGAIVLDPMCGSGTILLEAATSFKVGQVIASDSNGKQLQVARCNLRSLKIPVVFLLADATAMPLQCACVDVVVCDFPFGQKHKVAGDADQLLRKVLREVSRLLVDDGCAVFLLSPYQHHTITHSSGQDNSLNNKGLPLKFEASHLVSLGETSAYVTILSKEVKAA